MNPRALVFIFAMTSAGHATCFVFEIIHSPPSPQNTAPGPHALEFDDGLETLVVERTAPRAAAAIVAAMSLDHRQFRAGDPHTVRRYLRAATTWARRFLDDPDRIESVVQTTMTEILSKLDGDQLPPPERATYWIYGCTHNAVRRELTRMRQAEHDAYDSHVHSHDPLDMSHVLRLREQIERVEAALDDCELHVREILIQRVRGESYREIAKIQGMTEAATRQAVRQLRMRLIGDFTAKDKADYLLHQAKRLGLDGHAGAPATEDDRERAARR